MTRIMVGPKIVDEKNKHKCYFYLLLSLMIMAWKGYYGVLETQAYK